jgi:hypothetical protein
MIFSRYVHEASYCYENFSFEWSFKYFKNIMILKIEFLYVCQTPL